MATNKKITDLAELSESELSDDDVLAIVDISEGTTNKVRKSTLASALSGVSSITATSPIAVDRSTGAVIVSTGTIPINKGGTGQTAAAAALAALGGVSDPTTTRGDVITRGASALGRLAIGSSTTVLRSDGTDPSWGAVAASELSGNINLTSQVTGTLPVANGGTNATSTSAARTSLGLVIGTDVAAAGANSDITSITGLTTDLTVAQGGTGASTFAAKGVLFGNGASAIGATAVGTATQVLTSNGSGSAPTFQDAAGGGAWTLINTAVASDSADITVTGIDSSTYDTHAFIFTSILPASSGQNLYMRLGTSGGIITASNYQWHCSEISTGGTGYSGQKGENVNVAKIAIEPSNSSSRGGAGGTIYLTNNNGTNHPTWTGVHAASKVTYMSGGPVMGVLNSASNIDRVQLFFSSGNITSGRLSVYGIAHS
tara:strand:- start:633 stop:1922 length:1290 start_codon:yes stop_codon:yes gene_type:complete